MAKTSSHIWAKSITIEAVALGAASLLALSALAAGPVVSRDALVLDKPVVVRQFPDARGKKIATLQPCDEFVYLDPGSAKKSKYVEVIFLTQDAQKVSRGWILRESQMHLYPETRPDAPRADTTPEVAFPWAKEAMRTEIQLDDPLLKKDFLLLCLQHSHPEKSAAILKRLLDRNSETLTGAEVSKLLPQLRYARDEDLARIRVLLEKFKTQTDVAAFLQANPLFGPVIEPEVKEIPILQVTPAPAPASSEDLSEGRAGKLKMIGMGLSGAAVLAALIAIFVRRRKKKGASDDFLPPADSGPSID